MLLIIQANIEANWSTNIVSTVIYVYILYSFFLYHVYILEVVQ